MPADPLDSRPPVGVTLHQVGQITVATVTGEIDMLSAATVRTCLLAAVADATRALIIDLSEVEFMASIGLQVLLDTKAAADTETTVVVAANGPVTARPIEITGINEAVPLYRTLDEALRRLR